MAPNESRNATTAPTATIGTALFERIKSALYVGRAMMADEVCDYDASDRFADVHDALLNMEAVDDPLDLIRAALRDPALSETATLLAVTAIACPTEPAEEHLRWAAEALDGSRT